MTIEYYIVMKVIQLEGVKLRSRNILKIVNLHVN